MLEVSKEVMQKEKFPHGQERLEAMANKLE
jgi:hypothetical protein